MGSVRLLLGLGEVTEVRRGRGGEGGGVETYLNLETGPALEFSNFDIDIHNNIMKKKPPYCLLFKIDLIML